MYGGFYVILPCFGGGLLGAGGGGCPWPGFKVVILILPAFHC